MGRSSLVRKPFTGKTSAELESGYFANRSMRFSFSPADLSIGKAEREKRERLLNKILLHPLNEGDLVQRIDRFSF